MDGTKLLMWYDQFVNDYYVQLEEMEYQKHVSVKDGRGTPLEITDDECVPVDYNELLASFHGKTKEELEREKKIAEIRHSVQKKNIHLYNSLPIEEADKRIENEIIEELKAQGLLTF
jgi:biotin-(acetyl-CoA carboxylase) ligase